MSSDSSHISHEGAVRLQKIFTYLDKDGLINTTNLKRSVSNEDYTTFFGINAESKSTWWSVWQYSRNKMDGVNLNNQTKSSLITGLKWQTSLSETDGDFNAIFKDCAKEIEAYLDKRNYWYLRISKDRILFLEKLFWIIQTISDNKNNEEKILNFSKLVKALSDIQTDKIWIGKDWGETSINHILKKVCDDLSVSVVIFVVRIKTSMSSVILDQVSKKLENLITCLNVTLNGSIISDQFNGAYFCKKIEALSRSQKSFSRINLYKISEAEFFASNVQKKYVRHTKSIYFRLELQNHSDNEKEFIFIESIMENFPVEKSIENLSEEEKVRLDYKGLMIVNYAKSLLWFLKHAQYLINISDYAFVEAVKGKSKTDKIVGLYALQDSIDITRNNHLNRNSNPFGSTESLATSLTSNDSIKLTNTLIKPVSLDPSKLSLLAPPMKPMVEPSISIKSVKLKGNKSSGNFLDSFKNVRTTLTGKIHPLSAKKDKARSSYVNRFIQAEPYLVEISYADYYNSDNIEFNYNFVLDRGNLDKINDFNHWIEDLSSFSTITLSFIHTLEKNQARNINILKTAISEINVEIKSLIESLEKTNAKAIARYLFVPLNDNQFNRNLYLSWVKNYDKANIRGRKDAKIDNIWIPLCDNTKVKDEIKKMLKKL